MVSSPEDKSTVLVLPETFQAPHLRHLALICGTLRSSSPSLSGSSGVMTGSNEPKYVFTTNGTKYNSQVYLSYKLKVPRQQRSKPSAPKPRSAPTSYIIVQSLPQKHNSAVQVTCFSPSGRITMSSSLSESPILESQQFTTHHITRATTIPEAIPTGIQILIISFRKENSNTATKNTQTLKKWVIVTI